MKRILITGANSYIGTSLERYLAQWPDQYQVDTVDMIGDGWKRYSFAGYDVVFHVAGIVHRKETIKMASLYKEVNCDLAIETAEKAKREDVGQFIFLSTMNVYGKRTGAISKDTVPEPITYYGKSKLDAEGTLLGLSDSIFLVTVIRPPMVYGNGCLGNYQALRKLALTTPVFPNIENRRSMIYIDNLAEFVKRCIDGRLSGIHFPQNTEPVCTKEMVIQIAQNHGKRVHLLNRLAFLRKLKSAMIQKIFGDLYYDFDDDAIGAINFVHSIASAERKDIRLEEG